MTERSNKKYKKGLDDQALLCYCNTRKNKKGSNKMYRILIYHNDEIIEELKKTNTLNEAEKNGEQKIKELNNDGHWWYKIKVD